MKDRTKELLAHPLTALAVLLSAVGSAGVGLFEPAWGLLSTTAGMWFPAIAVSAGTLLPELGLGDIGNQILLAAAIVFVAVQLDKLYGRVADYLENR